VSSLGPLQGRQAAFVLKYFLVERTLARAKALNTVALHLCWATWPTLGKPLKCFALVGATLLRCRFYSAHVHVHEPLMQLGEGQNTEIVK
jgi:hypothetical protein